MIHIKGPSTAAAVFEYRAAWYRRSWSHATDSRRFRLVGRAVKVVCVEFNTFFICIDMLMQFATIFPKLDYSALAASLVSYPNPNPTQPSPPRSFPLPLLHLAAAAQRWHWHERPHWWRHRRQTASVARPHCPHRRLTKRNAASRARVESPRS